MKISKKFIKATITSLSTTAVDLLLFRIICNNRTSLFIISLATVISRVISAILYFFISKTWVFESDKKSIKVALPFMLLFVAKIATSSLFVWIFKFIPIPQIFIKMFIDTILFFVSYYVQKDLIFKKKEETK